MASRQELQNITPSRSKVRGLGSLQGNACSFPIDHPSSCVPSTSLPKNLQDCMSLYAGRYKISGTVYAPHCPPNSAPPPYALYNGWMQLLSYSHPDHCNEIFKFNKLKGISMSCVESTQWWQWGYPNTVNGGCGRDFEEYYTRVTQPNFNEGEYTVRIQLSEGKTLAGGYWPWIRATFNYAQITYPGTNYAMLSLTMFGGGQPIIESNIEDVMNQSVDILMPSARTYIDEDGNEVGEWGNDPTYFYVFFEGDWESSPPIAAGAPVALILPGQNNAQRIPYTPG